MSPRLAGAWLAALHFCCGLVVALDPRSPHDEGLLMFGFARSLGEAFFPCLFLQKIKPALALVYMPFARLGLAPYLVAHLAVASAAIALVHATARSLGHARPWLPALVLALSPIYTWSGMVGVSNSDGVACIALFLYLLEARKSLFFAGLVLGLLPWVRYECALFSAAFAPWVLWRQRRLSFLAGLVLWPLLYLGAGALYHHDALWFVHFLPNVSNLDSGNEVWIAEFASHGPKTAIFTLVAVSPAVFFLLLVRPSRLGSLERALGAFAAVFFGLFLVTHMAPRDIGPAFTLGFSSRYAVVPVIGVALLLGRAIEALEAEGEPRLRDTAAAAALLGVGTTLRAFALAPLWGAAATGAVVAAMRGGAKKIALAVVIGFLVLVPIQMRDEVLLAFPVADPTLAPIAAWLEENPIAAGREIYTNHQLLVPYLARTQRGPAARARFLLAVDHHFELVHLSNPANGQRAAVLDAIPRAVFGDVVPPEQLDPAIVPPGTVFVLIDDARTKQILPPETWGQKLQPIHAGQGFRVLVFSG
ncbi:hypothetical protein [Polyangium sp. 6x1]|uniref:hypothetical protein n=1 Tax=Polyangium sp. 6x1 TaxID=3042689 RepID=UPI002482DC77|nr:hypothetical protein [Polyangium sp. 6x1]MDI1449535.1 hypothetical protein [Polyangium sp. 6x1]